MAREVLKTFEMVMDNTADIKNIVINNFFKSLDLGNNDLLNEFVLEKITYFNFCSIQDNFIARIKEIIDQEFKKVENSSEYIDYVGFQNSLINNLQQIKMEDIRLEDDIRNLVLQISDKFPMISKDAIFERISSKQEKLKEVILSTNKNVIDTLVKLTPQLIQDLKQIEIENQNKNQVQQPSQNIDNTNNNVQQQNPPQKTINLHDLIQDIRKKIYSKSISSISSLKSVNPFKDFKPIRVEDFQVELNKYNVSVDTSYINGIVSELNLELGSKLINKAKTNILQNIILSTNGIIENINRDELIQKYGINIDDKYMSEIIEYVNTGISSENNKRNIVIQSQQSLINSNNQSSDVNVSKKDEVVDLFKKYPGYKRLYECFLELANTETQKDAIEQIMKTGEYNGFKLNSMLSNEKDNVRTERNRRIEFAEMILSDESLFLNLANNGLNCFHGTKIDALDTILNKGLFSSTELNNQKIQLKTGEEYKMNQSGIYGGIEKRHFISLTDDFNTSVSYASFYSDEEIEYFRRNYGKELKGEPIIICFNGNDIAQKYGNSLAHIQSTCNEIGITTSIDLSDIKCIITSYDKIEYVQSIASKFGIDVLGYNPNNKFSKGLNANNSGKFYTIQNNDIVIDEAEFARSKETIKEKLRSSNNNGVNVSSSIDSYAEMINELNSSQNEININNEQSTNNLSNSELLNDDLSMKIASDIKMDIVFDLTAQYNNGNLVAPLTTNDLVAKYHINEKVAQQLATEINTMISEYIQSKKEIENNHTPYVLDDFEDEQQEISHKHR